MIDDQDLIKLVRKTIPEQAARDLIGVQNEGLNKGFGELYNLLKDTENKNKAKGVNEEENDKLDETVQRTTE